MKKNINHAALFQVNSQRKIKRKNVLKIDTQILPSIYHKNKIEKECIKNNKPKLSHTSSVNNLKSFINIQAKINQYTEEDIGLDNQSPSIRISILNSIIATPEVPDTSKDEPLRKVSELKISEFDKKPIEDHKDSRVIAISTTRSNPQAETVSRLLLRRASLPKLFENEGDFKITSKVSPKLRPVKKVSIIRVVKKRENTSKTNLNKNAHKTSTLL